MDAWATVLVDLETTRGASQEMCQWIFIRWYRECMKDQMSEWTDPQLILQAEHDGYDLVTGLPLHYLIDRKPQWTRRGMALPPPSGCGIAAPKHVYSNKIYSAFENQNEFLADVNMPDLRQEMQRPPIPYIHGENGERILIIVHLYSGRRRLWDFHHWIDELQSDLLDGWSVWTLSFDTAVHPKDGNLMGENFRRILRMASHGIFIGCMGGPPCETYSPARHMEKPPGFPGRWPRPLRSSSCVWGLQGLSLRELEQLRVGTKLYVHNALVEMEVVHNGGFAMLEHPADPMEEPKVSSWQTNFNRIFGKAMPSSIPIQIGQWKYGAESVKPTIIRSMGGDAETKRDFLSFQDHSLIKPTSVLAGLDSKGQFKTSAAKEYPWRLSKALAYTMLRGISRAVAKRPLRDVTSTLLEGDFEWLKSYARTSSCISADSHWLPDYQR